MYSLLKKFKLASGAALVAGVFAATSAVAAPFELDADDGLTGFDCSSALPGTGPGEVRCQANNGGAWGDIGNGIVDRISWMRVTSGPESRLTLQELTPRTLSGDFENVLKLTHDNIVIAGAFAFSINIVDSITLTDLAGPGVVFGPDVGVTPIRFTETLNAAPCPAPNPVGTRCDDFFHFTFGGLEAETITALDGSKWKLEFGLAAGEGVIVLPDPLDPENLSKGIVYTGELRSSDLFITARITRVSEPGSLALIALSLMGAGTVARRRKQG